MDKVIIYGLGKVYQQCRKYLEKNYVIIGLCDKDANKLGERGIKVEELPEAVKNCDYIIITSSRYRMDIRDELMSHGIPESKINFFTKGIQECILLGYEPTLGISNSEAMEDIIVAGLCAKLGISFKEMRYIELGTNNPIDGNNTYWFYERGASGICVEALPDLCEYISQIRKRDKVLNRAVYAGTESEVTLFVASNEGLSSLDEYHLDVSDEWKKIGLKKEINVSTVHINDIFEMLNSKCDLLAIDIEGYDFTALKSLDFSRNRPKIILIEMLWDSAKQRSDSCNIIELLQKEGYIFYAKCPSNGVFYDCNVRPSEN